MFTKPVWAKLHYLDVGQLLRMGIVLVIALALLGLNSRVTASQSLPSTIICKTNITSNITTNWELTADPDANPYCVSSEPTIYAGVTLTVDAGVQVYFTSTSSGLQVNGTLNAVGDESHPILFSTINTSSPAPNQWIGIRVHDGGRAHFDYVDLGYAGHSYGVGLRAEGAASLEIRHSRIHHNNGVGLDFYGATGSGYIIADTTFDYNTSVPILENANNEWINPTYTNLVFNGNGGGDTLLILAGTQNLSRTFDGGSFGGKPISFNGNLEIPSGVTITIQAGTLMQFIAQNGTLDVHNGGTLLVNGSDGHLVTLTSDEASKSPGQWDGLFVEEGGTAILNYLDLGYGGHDYGVGLRTDGLAHLELHHSHIHHINGNGMDFYSSKGSSYSITDSTFDNNSGVPIYENPNGSGMLPTYTNLVFNGNSGGDVLLIRGGQQPLSRTFDGLGSFNGKPIRFNGDLDVPNAVTITLQAGTVVQFTEPSSLLLILSGGILQVNGSAEHTVLLTSDETSKAPGQWGGVDIQDGGKAYLNYCDIGYGGHYYGAGLRTDGQSILEMHHGRIHDNNGNGLGFFYASGSTYTIADSTIDGNTGVAIYEEAVSSALNPTYTNLVFTGNVGGDFLLIRGGNQTLNRTFNGPVSFNGKPIVVSGNGMGIPSGVTLTFQAGTLMQFTDPAGELRVYSSGILQVNGADGQLVSFSSDEAVKGKDQWRGVIVQDGGTAHLNYCDIGYAGHDYGAGLRTEAQSTLDAHHCRFHDNNGSGLDFYSPNGSHFTVADSTFDGNSGAAVHEWSTSSPFSPTYTNLTFTGNGKDALFIDEGGIFGSRTVDGMALNGSPVVLQGHGLAIYSGGNFTINPGTRILFPQNYGALVAHSGGSLQAVGTGLNRVTFTSDQVTRNPGDWVGLSIESGGHATLSFCEIGYAGHGYPAALEIEASDIHVSQCRIHHSSSSGIRANGVTAYLVNIVSSDNQGAGLTSINSGSLVGLHTTIARNGTGIYANGGTSVINLTNTILAGNTTGAQADYNGVINLNSTLWDSNTTPVVGALTTDTRHINGPAAFAADGYHITLYSKALNAGVNVGVTIDIDGDPRPMPPTFGPDLGADEFSIYGIWFPQIRR